MNPNSLIYFNTNPGLGVCHIIVQRAKDKNHNPPPKMLQVVHYASHIHARGLILPVSNHGVLCVNKFIPAAQKLFM